MRVKILIGVLVIVLVIFSISIGRKLAFTASQETGVVMYMALAKQQKECIDANNKACLESTNKLLRDIVAIQANVLRDESISNHFKKQIDDFIGWNNSVNAIDLKKAN